MSKILIEGGKVIIEGHANDLETCNTLTNLCDELSTSDKFRTVKYESGYGEFESVSENDEKKFAGIIYTFYIYSNDGTTILYTCEEAYGSNTIEVTSVGVTLRGHIVYTYTGGKNFLGLSDVKSATSAKFPVGSRFTVDDASGTTDYITFYIVEEDPGYQVNIQSNDGTTTLAQNAIVGSVVVTSTGAQLKCRDAVKDTYTYAGSKLFAGLATSVNATAPKYKPDDTIKITAETTFYIVENIIIPDHHSSLNELFTNIATVIREKTGDKASIVADDFPNVIRDRLEVVPQVTLISFIVDGTTYQAEKGMTWIEWVNSDYSKGEFSIIDAGSYFIIEHSKDSGKFDNQNEYHTNEEGQMLDTWGNILPSTSNDYGPQPDAVYNCSIGGGGPI